MNNVFSRITYLLLVVSISLLMLTACSSGSSDTESIPAGDVSLLIVDPYKDECVVDGQYRLCYVVSVEDSGDFFPFTGEMQNFEYEWGYGYELEGAFEDNVFLVDEVLNKQGEPGGQKFPMTITGGDGHIVEISADLFEIYGQKTFTCSPEVDCESLSQVIDQDQTFTFEFETPDNPADPYTLLSWEG